MDDIDEFVQVLIGITVGIILLFVITLAISSMMGPGYHERNTADCESLSGFYIRNSEGSDICVTADQKIIKVY